MSFLQIFILALALSADAFTVGATIGLRHREARQVFRLSFHFGLFQSLLTLIGALAGSLVLPLIRDYDHWLVCAILLLIGLRMIYLAIKGDDSHMADADLTRGFTLIGLSVAVSIDALAAGIGLPAAGAPLGTAVAMIGIVAALATVLAMLLAERVKAWIGRRSELLAGFVLIGLAFWTPLQHLWLN
jgi:manganese efflux pump family protein